MNLGAARLSGALIAIEASGATTHNGSLASRFQEGAALESFSAHTSARGNAHRGLRQVEEEWDRADSNG